MGRNNNNNNSRQKKSSFSVFNLFKLKRNRQVNDDAKEDAPRARRVCPSDEDTVRCVADPGIDRKAADFIDRVHRNIKIASDLERKTMAFPAATAAAAAANAANAPEA